MPRLAVHLALLLAFASAGSAAAASISAPEPSASRTLGDAERAAGKRRAAFWLDLAEEARRGGTSSLFSQLAASEPPGGGRVQREGPGGGQSSATTVSASPGSPSVEALSRPAGQPREVEMVLEAGQGEDVAKRLAEGAGLEVTGTRRNDEGALVATVRAPLLADAERTESALRSLSRSARVAEVRTADGERIGPGPSAKSEGENLTDPEALARELLGDRAPVVALQQEGLPWKFLLGMLASLGLLGVAGWLYWSSLPSG